ncbi:MAG: S41 family peptidase [Alistipes sp.]|nr:S41 family peptidase [Alistipes sp.]
MKRLLILTICLVICCISASAQLTEQQQIQKLNYVYQHLRNNYVDDVPLEPLVEEAIKATLRELDPHSTYLSKEQMSALQTHLRGKFAGIGIRYIIHNDTVVVRSTMEHSPAQQAKIRLNDRIVAINNQPIVGLATDSVATLLRGEADTKVVLSVVRRDESKAMDITLLRRDIESSAISAAFRVRDVGYIAIDRFSKPLAVEFMKAYEELGDIKGLVVDLRNNGGGAITSAIDLSGLFLKKGDVIVSTEARTGNVVYDKKRDGVILDMPLVVIINESSASASEIFAGAIQDHDRGIIVGRTSFGKGLVQKIIDLKDGTGISLTIARYKTPSGRTIQRPYQMGGRSEYMGDTTRFMHPDSVAHDPELMFTTLKLGRKVYGGGGITPDIYIDTDTIKLSERVTKLYAESVFEHAAVEIWDRLSPCAMREQYPTIKDFNTSYTPDDGMVELLCSCGNCKLSDFTPLDLQFIRLMLKATLAEQIYGSSARSYIYGLGFDHTMQRALSLAENPIIESN